MTLQIIQLSEITTNGKNPRKLFDQQKIEQLAASIKQDGIIQNLVVTKNGKGYKLISGERRLRALHYLLGQGEIENSYQVPVIIRDKQPNNDNLRLAIVENVQREQMHPLDEAKAFFTLTEKGVNLQEVAAQSGVSIHVIQRRLLLVNLIKESKALYRDGEINLSQVEALAMGNEEEQKTVIERMNYWRMDADDIRRLILKEKPSVSIALFDKEKYTGAITTDLFADDDNSYFDDVEQFFELQNASVDQLVQEYEVSTTVDWVEIDRDNYFSRYGYNEAEEGENGGVIIHYRLDGKVQIHEGLVKRENITIETTSTTKERLEFSKKAYGHFANQKTILVQHAITGNLRKAKEVAVLQRINLCRDANIKLHQAVRSLANEQQGSAEYELKSQIEQDLMEFLGIEAVDSWHCFFDREYSGYYEAVKSLTDEQLDQLFALLVALSFGQENLTEEEPENTLFHEVARDLSIDIRDIWTPNEAYFNLLKKDQLLEIAEACGASIGKHLYKLKRKDLIVELVYYFADTKPLQNEKQDELRASFCPRIMQFGIKELD